MSRPAPTRPSVGQPGQRRLRVFAFDPGVRAQLDTLSISELTLNVPWEDDLKPGPVGEYLEVVDYDPASGCLLRPGRPERPVPAGPGRPRPVRGQPAVPPADGLRGRDEHDRPLRAGPRPGRACGPPDVVRDDDGDGRRTRSTSAGCGSTRTPCARRTPTTARKKKALLFGYFPTRGGRPGTVPRRDGVHLPVATTSSPTRRRTPCWTACTRRSTSRPTRTSTPCTRGSPTSSPCSSASPTRRSWNTRSPGPAATWSSRTCSASWPSSSARRWACAGPSGTPSARSRRGDGRAVGAAQAGPEEAGGGHRAARPGRHPAGRRLLRLPGHLQDAERRPVPDRHQRDRRPPGRGHPPGPGPPAGPGGRGRGRRRPDHVHPGARLLPAGGRRLRHLPARRRSPPTRRSGRRRRTPTGWRSSRRSGSGASTRTGSAGCPRANSATPRPGRPRRRRRAPRLPTGPPSPLRIQAGDTQDPGATDVRQADARLGPRPRTGNRSGSTMDENAGSSTDGCTSSVRSTAAGVRPRLWTRPASRSVYRAEEGRPADDRGVTPSGSPAAAGSGTPLVTDLVVEVRQRRRGYFDRGRARRRSTPAPIDAERPPPDFRFRRGCTLIIDPVQQAGPVRHRDPRGRDRRRGTGPRPPVPDRPGGRRPATRSTASRPRIDEDDEHFAALHRHEAVTPDF